tara:strand:- start:4577 stop:7489 length:2913 start_codon:yes stop_codon:yes gene_type:complete
MNTIILATIEAAAECQIISSIPNWLISEQSSNPIMGVFHDGLIGIFKLTRSNVRINKLNAMRLFGEIDIEVELTKEYYTGRDLVSLILQQYNINFTKTPTWYSNPQWEPYVHYDPTETKVVIEKGVLKQGVLDKNSVGQGRPGTIIHEVALQSFSEALTLIHRLQMLTDKFLMYKGMTIGIRDMIVNAKCQEDLHHITQNIINNSYDNVKELDAGLLIPPIGMTIESTFEQNQMGTLKLDDDFQEKVVQGLELEENDLWELIQCGSKGKMGNLLAISSSLGQQTIQGKRMMLNFGYNRSLPYYTRYDDSPESRGYVASSYMEGLNVPEFIFSGMAGRHAIINRALSTATVGEFTRAATKSLESSVTDYYRFVRIHHNINQYLYGDVGFKTNELKEVFFPTVALSDAEMKAQYAVSATTLKQFKEKSKPFDEEFAQLMQDRETYRDNFIKIEQMHVEKYLMQTKLYMPIDIKTLVANILSDIPDDYKKQKLHIGQTVVMLKNFCDELPYIYFNESARKNPDYILPELHHKACTLLKILIRSMLCTRQLIQYHITPDVLKLILTSIKYKLQKSLVDYGDYVGILAVHSVGETIMQYILDAHHRAGAEGTSTDFLTRVNELMYAKPTKKMSKALTYLKVKDKYQNDEMQVRKIASHIEMIKFDQLLIDSYKIFRTIGGRIVHPKYQHLNKIIDSTKKYSLYKMPTNLVNYCIVYTISHEVLIEKFLDTAAIANRIMETNEDNYALYNDVSSDEVVIMVFTNNPKISSQQDIIKMADDLKDLVVRGTPNIITARHEESVRTKINKDGSIAKEKNKEYVIHAVGVNMVDLLLNEYIDNTSVFTTSIREIEKFYGIEAARRTIINEMRTIIEGIQPQHYMMFADVMTSTGTITPIRDGAKHREKSNALLNISNSFIIKHITNAAAHNTSNDIYGASAPLMVGTVPKLGTLHSTIVIDEEFIAQNTQTVDNIMDDLF